MCIRHASNQSPIICVAMARMMAWWLYLFKFWWHCALSRLDRGAAWTIRAGLVRVVDSTLSLAPLTAYSIKSWLPCWIFHDANEGLEIHCVDACAFASLVRCLVHHHPQVFRWEPHLEYTRYIKYYIQHRHSAFVLKTQCAAVGNAGLVLPACWQKNIWLISNRQSSLQSGCGL